MTHTTIMEDTPVQIVKFEDEFPREAKWLQEQYRLGFRWPFGRKIHLEVKSNGRIRERLSCED